VLHKERGRSLKGGFGFDPLLAYLDETREALAGVLRPGTAGANTASDHLRVLDLALEQLGQADAAGPIVVRTDSAGATHQFTDELREAHINSRWAARWAMTSPRRSARRSSRCPNRRGHRPSARTARHARGRGWPRSPTRGSGRLAPRVAADRASRTPAPRRPAELHRPRRACFLVTLTDLDGDAVELERRHRARASTEDRIRAAKQTGPANLPFRDLDHNAVWLEIPLIPQDLIAWTQRLALAVCEPKTLRYWLLHTAARLAFHGRVPELL